MLAVSPPPMCLWAALLLVGHLQLAARFPPGVAAYWESLKRRDGVQRLLQTQHDGALAQGVSTMSEPDLWLGA